MRNFDELSEREIIALAIGNEEEDGRIYADFAEGLRENYPSSAKCSSTWRRKRTSTAAG